jgi:hypothetical protein
MENAKDLLIHKSDAALLFFGRRTTDLGHVNGDDDGVGYGVRGRSDNINGVLGHGVRGLAENTEFNSENPRDTTGQIAGVFGKSERLGPGVFGTSLTSVGVWGDAPAIGVRGDTKDGIGVYGGSESEGTSGVHGESFLGTGVSGTTYQGDVGVSGDSLNSIGVRGVTANGIGVEGDSDYLIGVSGVSLNSTGVYGESGGDSTPGVLGITTNKGGIGVFGTNTNRGSLAGWFSGNVRVTGTINKSAVYFQIDHPLDPANKYLNHSSIESIDMKNLYDGVVTLDEKGEAKINLPDWFGALNKDFRYQLTAIGAPGPNLYIAEEISENNTNYSKNSSNKNNNSRFKIAGGTSGMKVSWQVTGVRKDPYAKAHPIQVEEDKPDKERGYYIHPDLYEEPAEKGIDRLIFPVSSLEKGYKPLDKLKMKMKKRSPPK